MQPFQRFRQGNLVLSLAVRQDRDGRFYSQLCDVQEAFPGASLFKLEEVILNFLEDENRQKFEPKRVDHFPDHIIDVICRASFQNAALSSSHAAQLLSTEGIERLVSQLSIQPSSFSTKSRTLARSSTFSPASSASSSSLTVRNVGNLGTHQALVAARPMAALSAIASDITHIQHQLDRSADQQSAYHQQLLERLVHLLEEQADAKARDECVLAELTAARLRDEEVLRLQKQTIDRLIMAQQRIEAILVQNYELHEYPIPRLFVLLPDSYEKWDPRNVLAARFRLFFLCECGDFCTTPAHAPTSTGQLAVTSALPTAANAAANAATTTPITVKNSIHLAKHGGYELTRPTEFFDQYGPYVLGMLRILKHCLAVAAVISPVVALADSGVKDVMDGVKSVSESTMAAVDMSIDYLEKKLDDNDAGDDAAEDSDGEVEGRENMFNNLAALEGADLRRLDTFLRNNDIDKVLGNLYRITLATGEVKWVCLDHYRQIYRETAMASFVQSLEANGGTYEPHIGKVTIAIKSRAVFKDFFSRLSIQASSVSVLKTTFNWSFGSGDLAKFVEQISESNIRDLQVEFAEVSFAESLTQTLRPGKGKYYSLLRLLSNSKIKGLSLTNVALTGLRTSSLRTLPRSSLLQSFHFIGDVDSNDADRLVDIITHCTCLVDLRVGSAEAGSPFLSKVDLAISTLSKLKALHRYRLYRPDVLFNEIPDNAAPYGSVALKELVDTSMSFPSDPTGLLECAIRRSVATLEVLPPQEPASRTLPD
ncbi:hypothetical protein BGW39_001699 [Mortierella sp. 14UC]|nr:hypothetical protein BGW39_001699 [Mortierella sp. 14UC]